MDGGLSQAPRKKPLALAGFRVTLGSVRRCQELEKGPGVCVWGGERLVYSSVRIPGFTSGQVSDGGFSLLESQLISGVGLTSQSRGVTWGSAQPAAWHTALQQGSS